MPIEITITGATADETVRELKRLTSLFSYAATEVRASAPEGPPAEKTAVAEEVAPEQEKTFPEPKKRGRPRKEAADLADRVSALLTPQGQADLQEKVEAARAADEEPVSEAAPTLDEARVALADLLGEPDGKAKAKAIFTDFAIARISDLSEGQVGAFMAAIAKTRGS